METIFEIEVIRCSAWAPGMLSLADWQRWAQSERYLPGTGEKAPGAFLPAALRRRCSALSRASLAVAHACLPEGDLSQIPTVFGSRHGESQKTRSILEDLAKGELLSPNAFSLSVHNAASGLFSLAFSNRLITSAVAAADNTLSAVLFEAFSVLNSFQDTPVLLVIAEEPFPEVFTLSDSEHHSYAAFSALVCKAGLGQGVPLGVAKGVPGRGAAQGDHMVEFLRWVFNPEREFDSMCLNQERALVMGSPDAAFPFSAVSQ